MADVFQSLAEVPVDVYDGDDHDDRDTPAGHLHSFAPAPRLLAAAAPRSKPADNVAVPFAYVKQGDRGPQVKALKRALSRAGYGTWLGAKFTALMGPFATRSLNRFKTARGLPANGVYDKAAWRQLAPYFDAYSIRHLLNAKTAAPTRDEKLRNAFLAELMYLYNRRALLSYTQRRPFDTRKPPAGLDCSASGEWAAKWTGMMKSLSGYPSFGYGNTDSQLHRYRQLRALRAGIRGAEVGDPVYYGRGGDPSHVAFYIGDGRVWSFGAYPIKILAHDYRHDRIALCDLTAGQ